MPTSNQVASSTQYMASTSNQVAPLIQYMASISNQVAPLIQYMASTSNQVAPLIQYMASTSNLVASSTQCSYMVCFLSLASRFPNLQERSFREFYEGIDFFSNFDLTAEPNQGEIHFSYRTLHHCANFKVIILWKRYYF